MRTTCLIERHRALGARIEEFAGFAMPIVYTSIPEEHHAVRNRVGLFDVSHMGEIVVQGRETLAFVESVFTNEVASKPDGKIVYGLLLTEEGTVVDDLLVYRMSDAECLLVVNAGNIDKDFRWLQEHAGGQDVILDNRSAATGQLALQGPAAEETLRRVFGADLRDLAFYTFREMLLLGRRVLVSRSGYTGEDGFELYAEPDAIVALWDALLGAGVTPCGLGARDTLRFEAGLPLYGHEIGGDITPLEAGLKAFVRFDKADYPGRRKLEEDLRRGLRRKLVGIELAERAIPRQGYPVLRGAVTVGHITTGYLSLTLDKPIAMALLDSAAAGLGTAIAVQIRKRQVPGVVRDRRFLEKHYKK